MSSNYEIHISAVVGTNMRTLSRAAFSAVPCVTASSKQREATRSNQREATSSKQREATRSNQRAPNSEKNTAHLLFAAVSYCVTQCDPSSLLSGGDAESMPAKARGM